VDIEIRIVSHDSDYSRVSVRRPIGGAPGSTTPAEPQPPAPARPVGTRRAHGRRWTEGVDVLVDGTQSRLIDLSQFGAQVLSPTVLSRTRAHFNGGRTTDVARAGAGRLGEVRAAEGN
jgi:hypothetical protein